MNQPRGMRLWMFEARDAEPEHPDTVDICADFAVHLETIAPGLNDLIDRIAHAEPRHAKKLALIARVWKLRQRRD